jgi:hypothetical protein
MYKAASTDSSVNSLLLAVSRCCIHDDLCGSFTTAGILVFIPMSAVRAAESRTAAAATIFAGGG